MAAKVVSVQWPTLVLRHKRLLFLCDAAAARDPELLSIVFL